jgi:hypothetical protein
MKNTHQTIIKNNLHKLSPKLSYQKNVKKNNSGKEMKKKESISKEYLLFCSSLLYLFIHQMIQ